MKYALADSRVITVGDEYWIAPNAVVVGDVRLGRNASIWWSAVVRADFASITIGDNTNIQDGCVLHVDNGIPLVIGKDVVVGHKAVLHGCTVGDGSLIGIGAIVLNNARIGRDCLIGANALIPEGKEIPDRSLVMGSPGKVMRELTDEHIARIRRGPPEYIENWRRYVRDLTADD